MSDGSPTPPECAVRLFGDALPQASAYAGLLASDGVAHGHIGPREVPVLWERHLINSALVTDLVPACVAVLDVGSGAGLPGIPMALRRPDLRLVLLEPKQRRVDFLQRAITELGLTERVTVVRGRADDADVCRSQGGQQVVVARAVAPLERLVGWCLPLLAPAGRLLALKGASVVDEVERDRAAVMRAAGTAPTIVELGGGAAAEPTWVVSVQLAAKRRSRRTR